MVERGHRERDQQHLHRQPRFGERRPHPDVQQHARREADADAERQRDGARILGHAEEHLAHRAVIAVSMQMADDRRQRLQQDGRQREGHHVELPRGGVVGDLLDRQEDADDEPIRLLDDERAQVGEQHRAAEADQRPRVAAIRVAPRRPQVWQFLADPADLQDAGEQVRSRLHHDQRHDAVSGDEEHGGGQRLGECEHDPQLVAAVLPLAAEQHRLVGGQRHPQRHADNRDREDQLRVGLERGRHLQETDQRRHQPEALQRDEHHRAEDDERRRDGAIDVAAITGAERRRDVLGERRHDAELQQAHVSGQRSEQQPDARCGLAQVTDHEREQQQVRDDVDDEPAVVPGRIAGEHPLDVGGTRRTWFGHAQNGHAPTKAELARLSYCDGAASSAGPRTT